MEFGNKYIRFYRNGKILKDNAGNPLHLTTPYALADLWAQDGTPAISTAQTGDVVYLFNASKKYPVQRLERNKDGTFTLAEVDYAEDGGFEDLNIERDDRVYASAQTGDNVVVTATKSIFKQGHIGGLFYIEPINFNEIYSWSEGKAVKKDQRIVSNYKTYRAAADGTTGDTTPKHTEGTATDGKVNWIYEDCGYGIGKILSIAADGKSAVVKVLLPYPFAVVGEGRKTWKWKFGSWCEEYGYPTCGCFHRERLVVARGSRIWLSWSDDFENFAEKDFGDVSVIDDYAHHPTEMRATIQAARQKFPDKELVVVFQPHTFSRTKKYQKDFEEILRDVDKAYVTPIYASAREASGDISSEDLVNNIPSSEVIDLDNIADLTKHKNAVVVFMGAGDIPKYEDAYEKLL